MSNRQERPKENIRRKESTLFGGGRVLGDSLGTLRDGVLGKLTGQDQPDGGLDFPGGDGGLLVVGSQLRGLGGDTLKDVWTTR